MRVKIDNYIHHYTTTYVERDYLSWRYGEKSFSLKEKDYDLLDSFVITALDVWQDVLDLTINKIQAMRDRKVKIQIDPWDTWSADHTLAMIILPMLKQLKETKHGGPWVDAEDVPEELAISREEMSEHAWEDGVDPHWFDRWDYVLDCMIWSFDQIAKDDWMEDFYPKNETDKMDYDAVKEHQNRIQKGLNLFSKYYFSLWD